VAGSIGSDPLPRTIPETSRSNDRPTSAENIVPNPGRVGSYESALLTQIGSHDDDNGLPRLKYSIE
jgi:hypothetical protein